MNVEAHRTAEAEERRTEVFARRHARFLLLLNSSRFGGVQKKLADAIDLAPSYVSRVVKEKKNIGEDLAHAIEDKLELGRGWFSQVTGREWDPDTIELAEQYQNLTQELRAKMRSAMAFWLAQFASSDTNTRPGKPVIGPSPPSPAPSKSRGLQGRA